MKKIFIIMLIIISTGCATIPNGGYSGDISKLGTIGNIIATVRLGEGLLVGTVQLDNNHSVNLQIVKEDVPNYAGSKSDPLYYERTLTIGKFSKIWGSAFTSRKNIYYRKRIWYNGKDVFEVDGNKYLVEWHYNYKDPLSYIIADMYIVTFRALGERPVSP